MDVPKLKTPVDAQRDCQTKTVGILLVLNTKALGTGTFYIGTDV
jgi:hypothetical protein